MAKYNHLIYYPFRDRISDKIDLLKPKGNFFNLIVITSLCVVWMCTIFLSAILEFTYSDVTKLGFMTFVGLTIAIAVIATLVNMVAINRLFRLYTINIKNAFKVDYGN